MPAPRSNQTSTTSADERGSGLLGTLVGVTVFLVLLLFAVHTALNLYATTVVTTAAVDAARQVAATDGSASATARAEQRARAALGRYASDGGQVAFRWDTARSDVVVLDVVAERPPLLGAVRLPFQRVSRHVTVRWERVR